MRLVKPSAIILLAATALTLTACNTLSTRRDLFSPNKPDGPWTQKLHESEIAKVPHILKPNRPAVENDRAPVPHFFDHSNSSSSY